MDDKSIWGSDLDININWLTSDNVTMYDSEGNPVMCKCGKKAGISFVGEESFQALCTECFQKTESKQDNDGIDG